MRRPSIDTDTPNPTSSVPNSPSQSCSMPSSRSPGSMGSNPSLRSTKELTATTAAYENVEGEDYFSSKSENRYFIMKSLTEQDLVLSVRYDIWTTQYHNEELLNKVYEVSQWLS
jgi:hypothetical protein